MDELKIEIRLAIKKDIVYINNFYNEMYESNRTEAQWEWEYGNGALREALFAVALVEEKIVGTQALIPIEVIFDKKIVLTAKSEETLIHPSYRGLGIFEKMYDFLMPIAKNAGISFIWGFTPALKPFYRIGFNSPAITEQFYAPLSFRISKEVSSSIENIGFVKKCFYKLIYPLAVLRFRLYTLVARNNVKTKLEYELLELLTPPSEIEFLSRVFSEHWQLPTVNRSQDYLSWRILSNPHCKTRTMIFCYKEKILGMICFSVTEKLEGYIVDLIAVPSEDYPISVELVISSLLSRATDELKNCGAKSIRGWCFGPNNFSEVMGQVSKKLGYLHINRGEPMVIYSVDNNLKRVENFSKSYLSRILTEGILG
jgi:GNAT superfamily N-acetyltransferase